ncbi:bifunctional 4-hydroxy-2-oxoglutarate aldolase/2-dehydro-3-deoxy-phosphogluconate aldolase [Oceanobacillus alkalisoli]|uniref:bifunctional 4-hydroxy-2-oxoglutarate aldolase/2-dehydro-3-deoxy-phosphogluconate aldolase n=1 Tax=Oceanobacillus alkalisoli TaxID=2925113 RepID=UPI001EE467AD|nr:bifunctional 4-hydroxy-2-oxoglutarate aldolase/2-dehydro-3-deoxy-phosphogluconate aldolase [Oceanobacillus alkalisoli]MCG5102480.1 bifunctional 4-hydroxy-2-oxoglutarate aldolase/2-dehydro-3-deoxy-phosphogluconate aldolase [Oceanobacillus alkalisoli]
MKTKVKTIDRLTESGVIAVIRKVPKDKVLKVAESLIEGGVNALEITMDGEGAQSLIEQLTREFAGDAIIGAGTVLDGIAADAAIRSGAAFVVSPILKKDVIETTIRYGKVSIPGVMTPTEMVQAVEWGADIVKVFPASVGGPAFIKNIKGPLPQIDIIPTGGVDLKNGSDFIKAGAVAIGAGGNLVDKQAILTENYTIIRDKARQYVELVRLAREENID